MGVSRYLQYDFFLSVCMLHLLMIYLFVSVQRVLTIAKIYIKNKNKWKTTSKIKNKQCNLNKLKT
jgi:hypothetical protein